MSDAQKATQSDARKVRLVAEPVPVVNARACMPMGGLFGNWFGGRRERRAAAKSLSQDAQDAANRFGI